MEIEMGSFVFSGKGDITVTKFGDVYKIAMDISTLSSQTGGIIMGPIIRELYYILPQRNVSCTKFIDEYICEEVKMGHFHMRLKCLLHNITLL